MKVKCISRNYSFIKYGEVFEVKTEKDFYYEIQTSHGARLYAKHNFEIVKEKTLEEQLEESKKETARLEQLIADQAPKVGDKYHFDGAYSFRDTVMMLTKNYLGGTTYYSLIIIECPNSPSDVGSPWCGLTTNINNVFGAADEKKFTKL